MFGKHHVDTTETRSRKVAQFETEFPGIAHSEALDCLITAGWDLAKARQIVAMAQAAEEPLYLFLAMLEQK
jgi:hypothetical protein